MLQHTITLCFQQQYVEQHDMTETGNQLQARPYRPTSEADLSNALVAKWEQMSAARFLNLVESLPRGAQVSTYFWPCNVSLFSIRHFFFKPVKHANKKSYI